MFLVEALLTVSHMPLKNNGGFFDDRHMLGTGGGAQRGSFGLC
jgi:hypothetical protein